MAARNLSLTEELEKLEQSITLTLQEIDHNFSKAHRIVTTSILPVVEQYGEHSRAVWEASKFWKHFFEASANVSLSGYEDLADENAEGDETATTANEDTTTHEDDENVTASVGQFTPRRERDGHATADEGDSSLLGDGEEGDLTGSTPRPPATRTQIFSNLESPYEKVKREMTGGSRAGGAARPGSAGAGDGDVDEDENTTMLLQQHTARLPDLSMTPKGGSPEDARAHKTTSYESRLPTLQLNDLPAKDRLLHRVLDKTYRLQATPHKGAAGQRISPLRRGVAGASAVAAGGDDVPAGRTNAWADSPMSSPIMAAPKLRSEVFMSPVRATGGPRGQQQQQQQLVAPRTPGVSVNTPATRKTRDVFQAAGTPAEKSGKKQKYEIDWESDSEEETGRLYGGMSPPKTIQFALPPSKFLQTPAREASKRIVEDILMTAGAEPEESDYSPTMVKMNEDILNESF